MLFLRCVAEAGSSGRAFNHTITSHIPQNTNGCLQRYAVPSATADKVDACVSGPEGARLLNASIARTHAMCGHHSSAPRQACKSCTIFVEGKRACVLDDGALYNCTAGLSADPAKWITYICDAAIAKDYRGGGLVLRFVANPRKAGGNYDVAAHVRAMRVLYGDLSDNRGHHWNQFFDSHLGFYARSSSDIARELLRDGVPFFTGQSSGVYQSIYVVIPGTGHVVEVLGNWLLPNLPPRHVRFSSTDQFCSPKRRRRLGLTGNASFSLGVDYMPGGADLNKTTMAGADPDAAIDFAVRYLGGSPIQQHRGPMGDGPCTKLAWAEWPDNHEWHVVRYDTADWVSLDGLRPTVPYNISQLSAYVERLRDLTHGTYDQWLDFREVMMVGNLTTIAELLRHDRVPFGVWSRPKEGTCSLFVDLPRNGIAVELVSRVFDGAWISRRCAASVFDLCAAD